MHPNLLNQSQQETSIVVILINIASTLLSKMGNFTEIQRSEFSIPLEASQASMITQNNPKIPIENQSQISQVTALTSRSHRPKNEFEMGYSSPKKRKTKVKEDHASWLRGQFKDS